jgi:hypothetical protein
MRSSTQPSSRCSSSPPTNSVAEPTFCISFFALRAKNEIQKEGEVPLRIITLGDKPMSKAGDVFENPVTGERAVVRVGTEESTDGWMVNDLYVWPGGTVAGEHIHPTIVERFTVQRGKIGISQHLFCTFG